MGKLVSSLPIASTTHKTARPKAAPAQKPGSPKKQNIKPKPWKSAAQTYDAGEAVILGAVVGFCHGLW